MVKCQTIMDAMERIAPRALAEDWDNPGLLVGSPRQEISRVLVCLDVSESVLQLAVENGCNLIVAHHPLIFKPMKKLRTDLPLGHLLQELLRKDIAVYAAHTNLDIVQGGVNDVLARRIGLSELEPFILAQPAEGRSPFAPESLGRIGQLSSPMDIDAFAARVKQGLGAQHVRLVRSGSKLVRKVALCSGSGAEFIAKAAYMGADAYVTGDVKYHDAQQAAALGMHVIDAGHFPTEFPMVGILAERLRASLKAARGGVEITADDTARDFFEVVE